MIITGMNLLYREKEIYQKLIVFAFYVDGTKSDFYSVVSTFIFVLVFSVVIT